jgi:hypothetical protein
MVRSKIASGIAFLLEFQKLQKFPECNFASRKSNLLRSKRTISRLDRERFTLAASLPLPYAVTALRNDDMKFIAQQSRHAQQYLRWTEMHWNTHQIVKRGNGGKRVVVSDHSDHRSHSGAVAGASFGVRLHPGRETHASRRGQSRRYPLTLFGVNSAWKRLRKTAGVVGLRFHDFRHGFGTKLLRETGNLKLVQRHSIIRTSRARCDPPMC